MRSISRVAKVSINTVTRLLAEAGEASATIHDEMVRNVKAKRIQCDEIWSFCYSKQASVKAAKNAIRTLMAVHTRVLILRGESVFAIRIAQAVFETSCSKR